jgi:hypothetical protein
MLALTKSLFSDSPNWSVKKRCIIQIVWLRMIDLHEVKKSSKKEFNKHAIFFHVQLNHKISKIVNHGNTDLHWIHIMLFIVRFPPFIINQQLICCLDFDETGFSSLSFLEGALTIINFERTEQSDRIKSTYLFGHACKIATIHQK